VLWRIGKNDPAAAELAKPPFNIPLEGWREHLGGAFARAFKNASDETALAAFEALRGPWPAAVFEAIPSAPRRYDRGPGNRPRELRELAVAVGESGRNPLKLAMLSRLVEGGLTDPVTIARAGAAVLILSGEPAARDWIAAHLKQEEIGLCARATYEQHEDKLLWSGLPDPLPEASADRVWLLRAAAVQRSPSVSVERSEALKAHYASSSGNELYLLGRYVAGFGDETSIKPGTDRTRTAWALAVRAEAEGRTDDAAAWYGVATANADSTEPEARFADDRLAILTADL
jgi:hypothetical protein